MSIQLNLSTYSSSLKEAYQAVLDKSSPTDWTLFGYDKGTNDLKVVAQGDGGLEELVEEFEDDKVLYAFTRILDPNTQLPKFVLISWCGESAPVRRKGLLPSHLNEVQNFLKGYHVQINARDQGDVEPSQIMKRVDESSGAKYSYHDQKRNVSLASNSVPAKAPTTTIPSYTRKLNQTTPSKPFTASSNSNLAPNPIPSSNQTSELQARFLERVSSADKEREAQEKFEAEFRERQQRQPESQPSFKPKNQSAGYTSSRNAFAREDEDLMAQLQARRQRSESSSQGQPPSMPSRTSKTASSINQYDEAEAEDRRERELQQQRAAQEAEEEQLRQEEERERIRKEEERLRHEEEQERLREEQEQERLKQEQEKLRKEEEERIQQEQEQEQERLRYEEEQERLRYEEEQERLRYEEEQERLRDEEEQARLRQEQEEQEQEAKRRLEEEEELERQHQLQIKDELSNQLTYTSIDNHEASGGDIKGSKGEGLTAIALFEYEALDDNEIRLHEGEMITSINPIDEGWWEGTNEAGERGLFPANYVEVVESAPAEVIEDHPPEQTENANKGSESAHTQLPSAVALYAFTANEEGELSFDAGDSISNIEFVSEDWWQGSNPQGEQGLFPANYVELVE